MGKGWKNFEALDRKGLDFLEETEVGRDWNYAASKPRNTWGTRSWKGKEKNSFLEPLEGVGPLTP